MRREQSSRLSPLVLGAVVIELEIVKRARNALPAINLSIKRFLEHILLQKD